MLDRQLDEQDTSWLRGRWELKQTFYRWKKVYDQIEPGQARELKQFQEENARLRKLVANLSVDRPCFRQPQLQERQGDFSRPGRPTDNSCVETFNGSLRDECLNVHWFDSLQKANASWKPGESTTTRVGLTVLSMT